MKRRKEPPQKSPDRKNRLPETRIISTKLDLKKSGLVPGTTNPRLSNLLVDPGSTSARRVSSTTDERQMLVLQRLREQEESRRQKYVEMMQHDKQKRMQVDKRRSELKNLMQQRAKEKEAEAKERRINAINASRTKYDSMVNRLDAKESRRQKVLEAQTDREQAQEEQALDAVVHDIDRRQRLNSDREKEKATALLKRKKDADIRQRAAQALWDRQQRIKDAIRERNRAELDRLLSVPQPHLTARMPKYNFMDYPANKSMRRLLYEYKRKRIDEVTFNKQATELARKMSPRRILMHQNQLLREQLVLDRAAEGGSTSSLVHVSEKPAVERTRLTWHEPAVPRDVARRVAGALTDEALQRGGRLYRRLMQRSDVDVSTLLDVDLAQTFDDDGDLEQSLSAFDFGDEVAVDAAAVERIDDMYRSQACRVHSDRQTRAYPSGELDTFSSAVIDPTVSCSCTTLSGIDSQCSLCQLVAANGKAAAPDRAHQKTAGKTEVRSGLRKLFQPS